MRPLHVLNRVLCQKRLRPALHAALERRPDKVVEEEGSVDEQRESENLEPLECLPSKTQRDNPDEQCSASVDGGTRSCGNGARHAETEEVEATVLD